MESFVHPLDVIFLLWKTYLSSVLNTFIGELVMRNDRPFSETIPFKYCNTSFPLLRDQSWHQQYTCWCSNVPYHFNPHNWEKQLHGLLLICHPCHSWVYITTDLWLASVSIHYSFTLIFKLIYIFQVITFGFLLSLSYHEIGMLVHLLKDDQKIEFEKREMLTRHEN